MPRAIGQAHGKLILSGEHAAAYGAPVLGMVVAPHTRCVLRTTRHASSVTCHLHDLGVSWSGTQDTLHATAHSVRQRHRAFLAGRVSIADVLQAPEALAQCLLSDMLTQAPVCHGLSLTVRSSLPLGSGMGSSAALALSMLRAYRALLPSSQHLDIMQLAYRSECIQHGRTRGIDLQLINQSGTLYVEDGMAHTRPPLPMPYLVIHTGIPRHTTGECVAHAQPHVTAMLPSFVAVTQQLDRALQQGNLPALIQGIRDNHALLVAIGVVPAPIQQWIQQLECLECAAKIAGAGALEGDAAGCLLILLPHAARCRDVLALCRTRGYTVLHNSTVPCTDTPCATPRPSHLGSLIDPTIK